MAETDIWKFYDESDLSGYTLVIPSVAVGNVGQLACDLLISSLKMNKIASIYTNAVIPVIGYDPYSLTSNSLSGSCEIYVCKSRKLLVLQLRSPVVYKYAQSFLENVVRTFKDKLIKDIIVLTSSFSHEKKHVLSSPFRYLCSETNSYLNMIQSLNWQQHESLDGIKIFGGGFASLLYQICVDNAVHCMVLYKYCSEGDNIPDAYEMIQYLLKLLPLFSGKDLAAQLVQPVSWKLLFGRPPPRDIY